MSPKSYFTPEEKENILAIYPRLLRESNSALSIADYHRIRHLIDQAIEAGHYQRTKYGINPVVRNLNTALILCERVGVERNMIISILLFDLVKSEFLSIEEVQKTFGEEIAHLIRGLIKSTSLYAKQAAVESENFKKLLLSFAEDIRVIIIMIADRLCLMKLINHHPNEKYRYDVACEASYLYAPLAHRLGLYSIKSELEDLSLKYTNREIFDQIADKLNETKRSRDRYIDEFIRPVKEKLEANGLHFEIKGRTKSIYSIWNKMKKQKANIEDIYDLFAIRIIIDTPREQEKADCWKAYSIITDMYVPIPSRMKDWISIPKSNGYESLHITVWGPEQRWVEVQIRTQRMDEIAERGLAAHWKYKGIKSENTLDEWMNSVREVLESGGALELMRDFKTDLYDKEVFVFTPKGDLYKLQQGATLLDFAFLIHTRLGCQCIGGRVNGKNVTIRYELNSGDTIEILTSPNQTPKQDWLNIATTSKVRMKIKQALSELQNKAAEYGKELLRRRFKNRKIEMEDGVMMRLIKKMGYKTVNDFFNELAAERIDVNKVIDLYLEMDRRESTTEAGETRTAEEFTLVDNNENKEDELIIGGDIKGIDYKLSKCCNPIFGDEIFGFVSTEGTIKIHRKDCPNANHIYSRYRYRVVNARWSGKMGSKYVTVLHVVGNDDIGIVSNISSIINKEKNIYMRGIAIDSNDGLFQGHITVTVNDLSALNGLIKKLKTVKGVKDVQRSSVG